MNFERIRGVNPICKMEVSFEGTLDAFSSNVESSFYDARGFNLHLDSVPFGKSSFAFASDANQTTAGYSYIHSLRFRFFSFDEKIAKKVDQFKKVKAIIIYTKKGNRILLGNNDSKQNVYPRPDFKFTHDTVDVSFKISSLSPISFIYD